MTPAAPRPRHLPGGCWCIVRMHRAEREDLKALARAMGMSASELVRRLVAGAVAAHKARTPDPEAPR